MVRMVLRVEVLNAEVAGVDLIARAKVRVANGILICQLIVYLNISSRPRRRKGTLGRL